MPPGESQIDTRHATLRHSATTMAWPVLQFRLRMTEIRPAAVDDAQVIAAIYAHHVRHRELRRGASGRGVLAEEDRVGWSPRVAVHRCRLRRSAVRLLVRD